MGELLDRRGARCSFLSSSLRLLPV